MEKNKVVEELHKAVELYGLTETLYKVFGKNVNVKVGFTKVDCEIKLENIDFSVRAMNSLKRAGYFTVGEVIDAVAQDKLKYIKNLGIKTENEIKTRLLELGYNSSTVIEKKQILLEVLNRNTL